LYSSDVGTDLSSIDAEFNASAGLTMQEPRDRMPSMDENDARQAICRLGESIFRRGLTFGSSGNISIRAPEGGWLMTPTNVSLGELDPARLSRLDEQGRLVSGDAPTKEAFLHRVMYEGRPDAGAVVHLHSTHSVAVSCLADLDPEDVLPPITAYYVMRVGRLPLVPYFPPGDSRLAEAVRPLVGKHHAVLLANHGPVVAGTSLSAASGAIEELEETARLFLLLQGHRTQFLSMAQVAELRARFG
jgi:3-dehydro-4-phosphotetronate decarboxylase